MNVLNSLFCGDCHWLNINLYFKCIKLHSKCMLQQIGVMKRRKEEIKIMEIMAFGTRRTQRVHIQIYCLLNQVLCLICFSFRRESSFQSKGISTDSLVAFLLKLRIYIRRFNRHDSLYVGKPSLPTSFWFQLLWWVCACACACAAIIRDRWFVNWTENLFKCVPMTLIKTNFLKLVLTK